MATILIVDDLSANREVLMTLLRAQGHRLLEAEDGSQGLEAVKTEHPDLVITDILMPVMDGYELVRQLRLDPTSSGIPVIFYTAHYGEREARELAQASGVAFVLTKPFASDEVMKVVDRALSGALDAGAQPRSMSEFDREQLPLLRDQLSKKTGDLHVANARLRAVINIGLELSAERDPDLLLQRISVAVRDLFSATSVTVGILDRDSQALVKSVASGTDPTRWTTVGNPVSGVIGTVVAERRAIRGAAGDAIKLWRPSEHPEDRAFLAAPIASPAHVYGWIWLVGNEERSFTVDDEQLVMAISGQLGRIYELQHEIAVRKQAESALRIAEERNRFALEGAGVGIWDMDYTTGVLRWSPTLEAQYGLDAGTFTGTFDDFVKLVHPDDSATVLGTLTRAMELGSDFSMQHRCIRPDGTIRWLSGSGRVHLDGGKPVRGVGISLDVTERRSLEDQYQHAQKMEAVGRLAGAVAHDFNNVLTVILGYSQMLLIDIGTDDTRRNDILEIQQAAESAAMLTRQLLAFSRKEVIEPILLDLNLAVLGMQGMIERLIGEDVEIVLRLSSDLPPVKADRGQLDQIVMNLAVNARDAMSHGGTLTIQTANIIVGDLDVKPHSSMKPGSHVVLTVTDTGTGMTSQVQAHLFEPFFTTKEPGKGTGLGLATVHSIVARSGGAVTVHSEVGKGSSFKLYFPAADAADVIAATPLPVLPPSPGKTVLVVEDDAALRSLTTKILQRLGYTVLVAANAEDAVQSFEQNAFIDVLLTDVVMPGASGPQLTSRLVQRWPALKVVYMSGYTEDAIIPHGVLGPGIAFLHKPFTSEMLDAKIRETLAR